MKRRNILPLLLLSLVLFLPAGCYNQIENDLNLLERRIEKLEQRCKEMNTTLEGLRKIVDKLNEFDFLKKVETLYENGEIIGYTLYFTHSSPVTLYNGTSAETPILGVGLGEDGIWYWTVKYPSDSEATFLTDNFGIRIPTSAASPLIKIENGYWMVTYDGGEIWHNMGRATGEDGASFFESVKDMGDYVQFNLLNGSSIQLPTWSRYEKLVESCRKANQNLETFRKLASTIKDKVYVQEIIPILSGTDTIGFTLSLTDGTSYSFYNGTGTNAPVIGARRLTNNADDNVWYWTIRYGSAPAEWILDEKGNKIQANAPEGLSVNISIQQDKKDGNYYWAVAYGSGQPTFLLHNGSRIQVNLDVPDPVVESLVSVEDDMVCLTLAGEQTILIPLAKAWSVTLTSPVSNNRLTMAAGDTVSFTCRLSAVNKDADVLPVAADDFYASASTTDHRNWTIRVIAPASFASPATSKLNLLISNGKGSLKTVVVTIQAKEAKKEA